MIPRGEVGLIFAQMGLASGIFNIGIFSAITLMVMITTFLAPPLLRLLFPPTPPGAASVASEGFRTCFRSHELDGVLGKPSLVIRH